VRFASAMTFTSLVMLPSLDRPANRAQKENAPGRLAWPTTRGVRR